jgi:hypothetical protein
MHHHQYGTEIEVPLTSKDCTPEGASTRSKFAIAGAVVGVGLNAGLGALVGMLFGRAGDGAKIGAAFGVFSGVRTYYRVTEAFEKTCTSEKEKGNLGADFDYPQPMQGRYAKALLARICMDARKLHETLSDDDRLPAWVIGKVATANDRLHMASDYIRYKAKPGTRAYDGAPAQYTDAYMVRQALLSMMADAKYLHDQIPDGAYIAPFVPKFIYTSQDRLSVIADYMRGQAQSYGEMMTVRQEAESKYKFHGAGY